MGRWEDGTMGRWDGGKMGQWEDEKLPKLLNLLNLSASFLCYIAQDASIRAI